jgi:hypothetical protein
MGAAYIDQPSTLTTLHNLSRNQRATESIMDLHDFSDVAENYDRYVAQLTGGGGDVVRFHSFDPSYEHIAAHLAGREPEPDLRGDYVNARGNRERIWNAVEFDPLTQTVAGDWRFEELDADGNLIDTRTRPLRMRWSFRPENHHLLRLRGRRDPRLV